ncbi:hypothetical protein ACCS63_35575, partial [Rhizobium brockwellii]|uniref:hypothetical protein n=1 Tax=Rhizobium brockwellii TaxID=3019932 RepID=UPI003F9D9DA3
FLLNERSGGVNRRHLAWSPFVTPQWPLFGKTVVNAATRTASFFRARCVPTRVRATPGRARDRSGNSGKRPGKILHGTG